MKVIFHKDFCKSYISDPAAAPGRMESIVNEIKASASFITAVPASEEDLAAVHTDRHIKTVRSSGLCDIAALAAGGAVQAAEIGLTEPCFALIRPPGHHASADSCWGFCYFNNMAVALWHLKRKGKIASAFVLDFDLHYGDGTVNILGEEKWVKIYNPPERNREDYIREVARTLADVKADIIGISAGFDHHREDWGGLLETEDYYSMGAMVRATANKNQGGCFAILEGGYNHDVLGQSAAALMDGLSL